MAPVGITAAASIDLKQNEPGLLEFCRSHGWPVSFYSAAQLRAVPGTFSASRFVQGVTGVDNVRTHDLRHVGARLYLNAGASMEFLQSELGHSSMSTTQIYSGRLQARRGRNSASEILANMEREAKTNMTRWQLRQPAAAV